MNERDLLLIGGSDRRDLLLILVNGREKTIVGGSTLIGVLQSVAVDPSRKGIAVAVNDHVIRRAQWDLHELTEGDRVDVIQATQGG